MDNKTIFDSYRHQCHVCCPGLLAKSISTNIKLNNGVEMPRIGLGTSKIQEIDKVVYDSIKNGLRMIDTAFSYNNEKEVGEGINKALNEGIVERKDLFVITKLTFLQKHNPEEAIKNQLKTLNLSYVDLYLDHWPFQIYTVDGKTYKTPTHVLWKNMEDLVRKGYTKSIGVSNYNVQLLTDILSFCEIKPVINEIEVHPYFTNKKLIEYCQSQEIQIIAYNSLVKGTYVAKHQKNLNLLEENIIHELSTKYEKTPGQIALNWSLSRNIIVIPSSSNGKRITENLGSLNFKLSKEEIEKISTLQIGFKFCDVYFVSNSDVFS